MAREERGGVEGLKRRLYTRKDVEKEKTQDRTPLSPPDVHAATSWNQPETRDAGAMAPESGLAGQNSESPGSQPPFMRKKKLSFATKFFLGSIGFFLIAAGTAAALFFGGINTTSPQNITVEITAPALVDGGKQATFEITVTNRNTTALNLADIVVTYPEGARSVDDPEQPLTHERISIGTIKSGEQIKRTASALLYGQEGEQQKVSARLEYTVSGSNAVFEKEAGTAFSIGSSPVSLTVEAPTRVIAGDQFTMEVTVRSNSTAPLENIAVEGQYPFGFSVSNASPQASAGGMYWRLGTLSPGASKTIRITGKVEAAQGDERVFRFLVGANADPTDVHLEIPFITLPQTVAVENPFITGTITVEGETGQNIAVPAGKVLRGTVEWQNNLDEAVSGLELALSFSGPAVDKNSINGQSGFYQSGNSTIIWSKDREGSLSSVAPGAMGSFQFSFATLPPGSSGTLITNPTVTLNLNVRAVREGGSGDPETIASAATAKVTLASQLSIGVEATHASGAFSNAGPIPPRAESATSYTVTWTVKNSANTVANTIVETILPPYVAFVTAQAGSGIKYDSGSRTVRWTLGDVRPGVGYTSAAKQASFQVAITPSASQVGTIPALTGPTKVSGQDRFAQVDVSASAEALTTRTSDGAAGSDIVAPK